MNKIFKVVWNKSRNMYVAVSEIAKSHTKAKKITKGVCVTFLFLSAFSFGVYAQDTSVNPGYRNYQAGENSKAYGGNSTAIGSNATADANQSTAIGTSASAKGKSSIAVGPHASAKDIGAVAIGQQTMASQYSTAIGYVASANGSNSLAIGLAAKTLSTYSTSIGNYATSRGLASTAIGSFSVTKEGDGSVVSFGGKVSDMNSAIQSWVKSSLTSGMDELKRRLIYVADGINNSDAATVGQLNAKLATKADLNASNITGESRKSWINALDGEVSNRWENKKDGFLSISNFINAMGYVVKYSQGDKTVIGGGTTNALGGIAIGHEAKAEIPGASPSTSDTKPIAIGFQAKTSAGFGTSIGSNAETKVAGGIALGAASISDRDGVKTDSEKAKAFMGTDATVKDTFKGSVSNGAFSIGKINKNKIMDQFEPPVTRQLTGLAAGTEDTDAVNVAQAKALKSTLETQIATKADSSSVTSLTQKVTTNTSKLAEIERKINNASGASSSDLDKKANLTADNLKANHISAWQEKLGNGTVDVNSKGLVTGKTVHEAIKDFGTGQVATGNSKTVTGSTVYTAIKSSKTEVDIADDEDILSITKNTNSGIKSNKYTLSIDKSQITKLIDVKAGESGLLTVTSQTDATSKKTFTVDLSNDTKTKIAQIETNTNAIATNVGNITKLENNINSKADKSEVNELKTKINGKADSATVTALENTLNEKINGKADATTVTQLQTTLEGKINNKADTTKVNEIKSQLETQIATKASTQSVNELKTQLEEQINQKASTENVNSIKNELESKINEKASTQTVTDLQNNLTTKINQKADTTTVNSIKDDLTNKINSKADSTTVTNIKNELDGKINGKADINLGNIDDTGKSTIRNLAKESVKVEAGENTTVTTVTSGDATVYKVNVSTSTIKNAVKDDLARKADISSVHQMKTELDGKINNKADTMKVNEIKTELENKINEKASTENLNEAKTQLEEKINKKADNSKVTQIENTLNSKADSATVTQLSEKVTTNTNKIADIESKLNNFSTNGLDKKANKNADNLSDTDISAWRGKLGNGQVAEGNKGLVSGETVFNALKPINEKITTNETNIGKNAEDITKLTATVGSHTTTINEINAKVSTNAENITKLETDLTTKINGKADINLGNIDESGKTKIRTLAKESVKVANGENTTVTTETSGDATVYKVNVSKKAIKEAVKDDLARKADSKTLREVKAELTEKINEKADNSTVTNLKNELETQINAKADSTTVNEIKDDLTNKINKKADVTTLNNMAADLTGKINEKADKNAQNLSNTDISSWREKLGNGTITKDSEGLVSGKTVFNALKPINEKITTLETNVGDNTQKLTKVENTINNITNVDEHGNVTIKGDSIDIEKNNAFKTLKGSVTENQNTISKLKAGFNLIDSKNNKKQVILGQDTIQNINLVGENGIFTKINGNKITFGMNWEDASVPRFNVFSNGNTTTRSSYDPGTKVSSMTLNKMNMVFGKGLKAEEKTDANGTKYTQVTIDENEVMTKFKVKTEKTKEISTQTSSESQTPPASSVPPTAPIPPTNEFEVTPKADKNLINFKSDKNISIVSDKTTNTVKVGLNDNISVKSVTSETYKVGTEIYIDNKGLNANGKVISNVKAGEKDSDAVNVGQLKNVENKIGQIGGNMEKIVIDSNRGDALGAALSALKPLDYDPYNRNQIMAGISTYKGTQAIALGLAHYSTENFMVHAGLSYAGSSDLMANVGLSYRFGSDEDREAKKMRNAIMPQYKGGAISSVYVMQNEMHKLQKENETLKKEIEELKTQFEEFMKANKK